MTSNEAPIRGRGTAIGEGVTWVARWSLRSAMVAAGVVLLWLLIGYLWSIVFPVVMGVILATVLWPPDGLAAPARLVADTGRDRGAARRDRRARRPHRA